MIVTAALALVAQLAGAPPSVPTPPAVAAKATAATASAPAKAPYQGLGVESVSPEVLAKFRAPPLASEVSRKVQAMLDVRAPSPGLLSPDGRRLYFTWGITGVRQVWRSDGPMMFPLQLTGGEDPTSIFDVTPDGKTLVLVRDRKGEENPGIYLQSVDGGPLVVVQHKAKVQSEPQLISDDGKFLYFRANDVKPDSYALYRYVFATKQIEPVALGTSTAANASASDDGLWGVADRRVDGALLLRKEVGSNQAEYSELFEGKRTPLFGQDEREDYVAAYGVNGEILVRTPKLGEFRRLYSFDRKTHELVPISPELKWDVAGFTVDHKKTRILVSVNEGGTTRTIGFDAETKKPVRIPDLPKGDHVVFGASTRDGKRTTVLIDAGTAPAASYVFDWNAWKLTSWHVPSAPEVDLSTFVHTSLEEFPARDGSKIPMFVRRPKACTVDSLCPVIIDFHGGPEAQSRAGFNPRAQLFVDAGYIYVQPNVRGSDGYGKTWLHADDGVLRKNVVTDIEDAALFVKQAWAKGLQAPKIGVFGGSYGGYSSLLAMTMFAGAYDCGVEVVGISSLLTFLDNTAPYRRALRISEYGDPDKDRAALAELSPINHVSKTTGPLLMFAGATDPRVPVGEAVQMYEALEKKKLGPKLIIFPDEGHGVQKRENEVLLLGHTLAFFDAHLK